MGYSLDTQFFACKLASIANHQSLICSIAYFFNQIKSRFASNVVQERKFSELLANVVKRYQNRAIETAQIIQELIDLAKEMRDASQRGQRLKLTDDEHAAQPRVRNVLLAVNLARHSANGWDDAALPDDAVITAATLKIKKQGQVGANPFTLLGGLKVDMRKPHFGATPGLAPGDFQAPAGKAAVATFGATAAGNWYSAALGSVGRAYVNKSGTTQFRLRFATDDNDDNGADYMRFYSGNAAASVRPVLVIEYYVP